MYIARFKVTHKMNIVLYYQNGMETKNANFILLNSKFYFQCGGVRDVGDLIP